MSTEFTYTQTSDLDPNGPTSRFWVDISLREIRLIEMHNAMLNRMRDFLTEAHQDTEVRRELLGKFPEMQDRATHMLGDARKMFQAAKKYERSISGGRMQDRVTREMAERFAAEGASTEQVPATTDAAASSSNVSAPTASPNADVFTTSSQPTPLPEGGPASWHSSLPAKRHTDDDSESTTLSNTRKKRRLKFENGHNAVKRTPSEFDEEDEELNFQNKRRRIIAPSAGSRNPTGSLSPKESSQAQQDIGNYHSSKARTFTKQRRAEDDGADAEDPCDSYDEELDAEAERRVEESVKRRKQKDRYTMRFTNKRKASLETIEDGDEEQREKQEHERASKRRKGSTDL